MTIIEQFFENKILCVALISWFIAQGIQLIFTLIVEHKLEWWRFWQSGGMPSAHSALVTALAVGIGETQGYNTGLFTIAIVFALIVMYDAANVRLETGKQGALLNKMIEILQYENIKLEKPLKEFLGHTRFQVMAGAVLGMITVFIIG